MTNKQHPYHILINEQSGTVARMGKDALKKVIANSSIEIKTLHILAPAKFFEILDTLKDSEHPILIGGGDGTIKSVAENFMGSQKSFGILPMGTMNLLARDLNIPIPIADALKIYTKQTHVLKVDMGMINNRPFLCCVGLGTMPETSKFREENREQNDTILMPRLTVFMLNQMDSVKHRFLRISLDGKKRKIKTAALVISNNKYFPQNGLNDNNFERPSLRDGMLGIYSAAPASLWGRIRLMLNLRLGNWRNDPVINEWEAETVCLKTEHKEELISLDGETENIQTPLNFWIEREALPLLVPKIVKEKVV